MKIQNLALENEQKRKWSMKEYKENMFKRIKEGPTQEVVAIFTHLDGQALNKLRNHFETGSVPAKQVTLQQTLITVLEGRSTLKELTITDNSDTRAGKRTMQIPRGLFNELEKESSKHGVTVGDYIRGVIYTTGQSLNAMERKAAEVAVKSYHNSLNLMPVVPITPKMKAVLRSKHGDMNDEQLKAFVENKLIDYVLSEKF